MRISIVSPGFPPRLGGVEVVVGYLADELHGDGDQGGPRQRPRGSSFPASPLTTQYAGSPTGVAPGSFRSRPGSPRAVARQRDV